MPTKRSRSEDDESGDDDLVDQVLPSDGDEPVTAPSEPVRNGNDSPVAGAPEKKRRGRPPGSKNKKSKSSGDGSGEAGPSNPPPPKRPRGRPRKPRTSAELEAERLKALQPKRPRGRPPKKPKLDNPPQADEAGPSTSTAAQADQKPRGRPKKSD